MVYTSRIRGNACRRPRAFWGALIPAAINFVGGLITSSQQAKAQKRALEEQQRLAQQQLQVSNQNNLATTLNNYASANNSYSDEDYNLKYRNGGTRRLGSNGITITDGGNARKIGNNTYLLRGGSHEDINETGQTGIGINVGGNEIEAEGGEVAQKKNKSLRIFSAQPMLSGGLSPAQAIIRGYNKDKVFAAQQRFKRNNNLNDDGSQQRNGGLTSKDRGSSNHSYPSVASKDFAGGSRSYPIPTKADAIDALRLAGLHGRSDVRSKVYSKYPELRKKAKFGDMEPPINSTTTSTTNTHTYSGKTTKFNTKYRSYRNAGFSPKTSKNLVKANKLGLYGTIGGFGTMGVGTLIGANINKTNKANKAQLDAKGKPISPYISKPQEPVKPLTGYVYKPVKPLARPQEQVKSRTKKVNKVVKPTRQVPATIARKDTTRTDTTRRDTTKQVNKVVKRQVRTTPQYTGNTTRGNYQLHDGETKVINGIKYTRRGNTIINHKTNVGYIYDKNGNYTGQADYSKVGNFNQAFDAARAAGRSQFIYRAGKYNNYSTAKETNAKKEALNRRVGARRIAKRCGGIEHARRRAALGTQSRYGFTGDGQFYYDKNRASYVDNPYYEMSGTIPKVVVTAPKKTSIDLSATPYLGRQNTFKPAAQDYIGLGIDTLTALGSGLFTRSAYNKLNFDYALPNYVDESPVAFDTIYHNEAQRANVERNRLNSRNLIRDNTSSAQTALGRMQQTDIDAMIELNKLADEKANKEVELRNQNAANEQQVRARNAAARNQYYQNVAQIKNAALEAKNNAALAKAQSIGADLSGLSQAWTNFAGSVEQRYNTRQNEAIIAATSKEPAVLSNALQFGYNFSPEVLASIYRSTNDDKLKQLALSRLSPSDRRRYSLFQ